MSKTPDIDIRPDHWEIVRYILQKHVPQYEVWVFGSRAKWTAKEFSDLDLSVMTGEPLPPSVSAALEEAFDESDLPFKVDIVDWAIISNEFKERIKDNYILIHSKEKQNAIAHILGALDDKIELNHRMNETLESIARAVSKSCFVDFNPVRAKVEGRQILIHQLFQAIDANALQSQTLIQLRGTLLMGQIGVSPP